MSKLLSGRVKKLPQSGITSNRYQYLGLEQAEPDLGDPLVGPSSIGAKPFPAGDAYVLASFGGTETQPSRHWVLTSALPGLGVLPGAVTIRENGTLVGAANSFYVLNFVGDSVNVDDVGALSSQQTGIATIRFSPVAYGNTGEFQYKNSSGLLAGVPDFKYDISTTNVGFGTTLATEKLHISGNVRADRVLARTDLAGSYSLPSGENINNYSIFGRLRSGYATFGSVGINTDLSVSGVIYASNGRGNTGEVLTSQGNSPAIWAPAVNVTVGSANSIFVQNTFSNYNYNLIFSEQNNNDIGAVRVDVNQLVYNPVTNNLGIGTSTPQSELHVEGGDARISGVVTSTGFYPFTDNTGEVGNASLTWSSGHFSNITVDSILNVRTAIDLADNDILRFGDSDDWQFYHNGTDNIIGLTVGDLVIRDDGTVNNPIILELQRVTGNLGIGSSAPTSKLDVNGSVKVSGISTFTDGPVFIGTGTSTGTSNQRLQVTGGAYVSGNLGIGTTNPNGIIQVGSGSTQSVVVSGIGSVGIGTTNPRSRLDLIGVARMGGNDGLDVYTMTYADPSAIDVISTEAINRENTIKKNLALNAYGGNVLVGAAILTGTSNQRLQVTGGAYVSGNLGIGTTNPSAKLHLIGDSKFNGTVNLEKSVTEQVSRTTAFSSEFPVTSGTLTIDVSSSTVAVGILTTSVSTWNFTGVSTENSKATTITLIADSSSLITYGEQCNVNGSAVAGGVRWNGGVAPVPTDNEDIISFAIVRDVAGTIRVYGSVSLNFS